MTPGGLSPEIQEILNKYEQAPVPGGNLVNSPYTLKLGNQEYTVNSPEEAQRILDHSLTQAGTMVSQLENQVRALMAEKAALEAQKTAPPEKTDPVKPQNVDSMEFLGSLAESPTNAIVNLAQKDPRIAQAILESSPQFKELQERLELNSFKEAHPFYAADQRTLEGLKTIVKQNNLPLNAKTLELAVGHAVNQGWLPHEQVIRQQQQQQFLAMQAQQAAMQNQAPQTYAPQTPQNNVIPFPQQPQQNNYQPPPRVNGGGNQGMPSIEDRVTQLFSQNNYTPEQMKQMLQQLERTGVS